ncbi:MAG: hypothetical protein AAF488_03060 [Planctomycetota bacterium]
MSENSIEVPREAFDRIVKTIASDASPVGIDAKQTHVIIIHKLEEIERRLTALERERGHGGLSS